MPKIKSTGSVLIAIISSFLIFLISPLLSQEKEEAGAKQPEDLQEFMEEGMKEIEYYSLEELLNVEVEVASLFTENELVVSSTVSSIQPEEWRMLGAKRVHETLGNEMGVTSFPAILGSYITAIRGYAISGTGTAFLVDGVPMTDIATGTAIYLVPNWELGTLNKIEMIKGPGSAIYGSDAFHGVISLKTFESDTDQYSIEGAGAYPLYGDANLKISKGFAGDILRIDAAAGASYQGDQDLEYTYNDPNGFNEPAFLISYSDGKGTSTRKLKYDSQTGVIKARIKPADKINLKLGMYINRGEYEDFPGVVSVVFPYSAAGQSFNTQDNDVSDNKIQLLMSNGSADYTFPNKLSVEANGYYWQCAKEYSAAATPKRFEIINYTDETVKKSGATFLIKQPDNPIHLQWLIAYSCTYTEVSEQDVKAAMPAFTMDVPANIEGYSRNIHSGFGQIKWGAVKDKFYVLLGGRNDYYSDFGNQVTPRGGLIFLPSVNSSIKALYGKAFRAPSAFEQKGKESYAEGNPDLDPEVIDIYELIFMYKQKKCKISINTFYSRWQNAIVIVDAPAGSLYKKNYVNKGENDSFGGELNLFMPVNPFTLDLGFSYIKSRALDVPSLDDPEKTEDRYYRIFPEYSFNIGLYYTLKSLDINFYLNNVIYLNMKETTGDVNPHPDSLPQYYRMDFNASKIISNKLELHLNIKNVLNRENRLPSLTGSEDGYIEPGISVMLRAGYKL